MVAQVLVLFFQPLKLLVFVDCFSERGVGDFICQGGKVRSGYAASFPFLGQFLPDGDSPQAFVYPIFRVSFQLVIVFDSVLCKFGILDFIYAFLCQLGEPLLERLRFL